MTISVKIIADSISPQGHRITTYELEYPRFIHAEFMTHRLFSRNAASSRAIPVKRAIELIRENTARPIHWGKNQPGMSAKEECNATWEVTYAGGEKAVLFSREQIWDFARNRAIEHAEIFDKLGYHKQIVNRLLEPFTHIKVVCTATEYDNFFWLRCHPDAQPEIQKLAEQMWLARHISKPRKLYAGEWHVPYYQAGYWEDLVGKDGYTGKDMHGYTLQEAIAISASCSAQVSYRKTDDSLEKALDIYKRLVESKPVHASPFEHQATPIDFQKDQFGLPTHNWEEGITHQDRFNEVWSGNFRGWIQNRQLIPENACWEYQP